jgi:FtsZ-interacting cell division protein ZipA
MGGLIAIMLFVSAGCSQDESESLTTPESSSQSSTAERADGADEKVADDENAAEYRIVENAVLPAPGTDPLEMIFELRQPDAEPFGSEQIRVSYPAIDQAVVVWVQRGLMDDSVSAMRTRYEFRKVEGTQGQLLWEVVQVTQQNKCHAGRGSEDWTGALCR